MGYNNGGDDGTMIIVMLMISMVCCCCVACGSSMLTAWANDGCDTTGTFSFLVGDWYTQLTGGVKLFQCTAPAGGSGGGAESGTADGGKGGANVALPEGKKCNPGTIANYDYTTRVWNADKNAWECPSGYSTTWCGVATDASGEWVDGENNERQCRIRKGPNSSLKVTLVDDAHRDDGSRTYQLGVGEYKSLKVLGDRFQDYRDDWYEWNWNDKVSAIDVPEGLKVILYEHPDFGGDSVELVGRNDKVVRGKWSHWIDGTWNHGGNRWDTISSMKILTTSGGGGGSSSNNKASPVRSSNGSCAYKSSTDKVWLFEKENYKGRCISYGSGTHAIRLDANGLNNSVGSLKFPKKPKRKVKLCANMNQNCKYFTKDKSKMYSSHKLARQITVYK